MARAENGTAINLWIGTRERSLCGEAGLLFPGK